MNLLKWSRSNLFLARKRRKEPLSSSSTIEISACKPLDCHTSIAQKCLIDKDIIEQAKPKFWSSTLNSTSSAGDLIRDEKIEEIRKLLPENHFDCSFDHTVDSIHEGYEKNVETKFVINLFESRRSQRGANTSPRRPKLERIEIIDQSDGRHVSNKFTLF